MRPIVNVRPPSSPPEDRNAQTRIPVRIDRDPEFALIIQLPLYNSSVWDSGAKHGGTQTFTVLCSVDWCVQKYSLVILKQSSECWRGLWVAV